MQLSRYLKVFPHHDTTDRFLLYSTLRGSLIQLPAALLERARRGTLQPPEADTLARLGMLVEDPAAEKEQMRGILERANARSRTFRGVVVLNLDCNLDCGYCYEGNFRGGSYMSRETAHLVVDTLLRDHISQGRDVTLTFYGGEPLLSRGTIRAISRPLLEGARRHGVRYSFGLVTNGTLLNRETALELIPLGLTNAKFTLDGPREIHDRERPYASGAGSFDSIVENIRQVSDLVQIQLGGNFRQDTYRLFPQMLDHLLSCGIAPPRIGLVQFAPVTPKAGCPEYRSECATAYDPWILEATGYLREEILSRGFKASRPSVSTCVVELEKNLVIGVDGLLYKCPAFMGWPELSVGSLECGIGDYRESHCIGAWQCEECLECCYLPLCFGGCRFLNLVQGKPLGALDCRKAFLDATLEETLRQNAAYPAPNRAPAAPSPAAAAQTAAVPPSD